MKLDALSHQIDYQVGEGDNQDQIMLSADHFLPMPKLSAKTPNQRCKPANPLQQTETAPLTLISKEKGQVF